MLDTFAHQLNENILVVICNKNNGVWVLQGIMCEQDLSYELTYIVFHSISLLKILIHFDPS
jgi:hypothetical protein